MIRGTNSEISRNFEHSAKFITRLKRQTYLDKIYEKFWIEKAQIFYNNLPNYSSYFRFTQKNNIKTTSQLKIELIMLINPARLKRYYIYVKVYSIVHIKKPLVACLLGNNRVKNLENQQIYVETRYKSIQLPIFNAILPFHISKIINIYTLVCNYERVNFMSYIKYFVALNLSESFFECLQLETSIFSLVNLVHALIFRSKNHVRVTNVIAKTKYLRALMPHNNKEKLNKSFSHDKLIPKLDFLIYVIKDVWAGLIFNESKKKHQGSLELYSNRIRFIDIFQPCAIEIYIENIRHAFFQTTKTGIITLIHLNLYGSIIIGKMTSKNLQFYTDLGVAYQSTNIQDRDHTLYDDTIEEKVDRNKRRKRTNEIFKKFILQSQKLCWDNKKISRSIKNPLVWEGTIHELAFDGITKKTVCTIFPTKHCLVELTEIPPTIISLAEVEIISLERAALHLKNFDMVLINKDFSKDVVHIDAISITKLETIKEWLTSVAVKFFESAANLNWKQIMRTIVNDRLQFKNNGGWNFLNLGNSESDDTTDNCDFVPESEENDEEASAALLQARA